MGIGKTASFLAIAAVVATGLIGSAYSLWYENLTVQAKASTTNLDAAITCLHPAENEANDWPPPAIGGVFEAYPVASIIKDVASASIQTQTDIHTLELNVTNAYPGYAWDCELHLRNTATLPWHVEDIQIAVQQCDSNGFNCTSLNTPIGLWTTNCDYTQFECTWGNLGINPPNYPSGLSTWSPLFIDVTDWLGCQVHHTSGFGTSGSFFFGVNQSAKEHTQYKVTVSYRVNQWNESNYNGCGQPKTGFTGPMLPPPD